MQLGPGLFCSIHQSSRPDFCLFKDTSDCGIGDSNEEFMKFEVEGGFGCK